MGATHQTTYSTSPRDDVDRISDGRGEDGHTGKILHSGGRKVRRSVYKSNTVSRHT